MRWPPKARKDWYIELKRDCFNFTHVLWYIVLLINNNNDNNNNENNNNDNNNNNNNK